MTHFLRHNQRIFLLFFCRSFFLSFFLLFPIFVVCASCWLRAIGSYRLRRARNEGSRNVAFKKWDNGCLKITPELEGFRGLKN